MFRLPPWLTGRHPNGEPYHAPSNRFAIYASHIDGETGIKAAGDYMRRWILQTPWFTVHLHNILRPDRGEVCHDHPWNFTSLILSGGYIEEGPVRADGDQWDAVRLPGDIARHRATDAHRITRVWPHTWTLVFTGPKIRRWGYHTPGGWVYYRDHHAAVR